MEPWVAISIIVVLGLFLIVLLVILHSFGAYTKLITNTLAQILLIRQNMAEQESSRAIDHIMHTHRRHDDPPPKEEIA